MTDPITQEIFEDPVLAEDGFVYDRKSIGEWLSRNSKSPLAGTTIGKTLIRPFSYHKMLEEFWEYGYALQYVVHKTPEICLAACQQNRHSVQFMYD